MTKSLGRLCFWVGFLLYTASFWLTATGGVGASKPPFLADLVIDSLLVPLIYIHQYDLGTFLKDVTLKNVSFAAVGWTNPIFLITMILMLAHRTPRMSTVFRFIVLLFVPLCWIALIYRHVYPREGYFLWTAGILLVLFSSGLGARGFAAKEGSQEHL